MYGVAVLLFRACLVVAGVAAAYLLWGLFSGQLNNYAGLPRPERLRIFENIALAGNVLQFSLGAAVLLASYLFFEDEVTGYFLVLAALVLWAGLPFLVAFVVGQSAANTATRHALVAFPRAALPFWILGGALIARDVVWRLAGAVRNRVLDRSGLQYGGEAETERSVQAKPMKRFLGKCWQGPFCREFIRTQCPVFHARKACWRVKKGCYCEPEIINTMVHRASQVPLAMAPEARYNFANNPYVGSAPPKKTELTHAQKRERCRNCVIYTEHQREKYTFLAPLTVVMVAVLCVVCAPVLRQYLGSGLIGLEEIMKRFSFGSAPQSFAWRFGRPSPVAEWILIGALGVMALSKALQALEWAIFRKMI